MACQQDDTLRVFHPADIRLPKGIDGDDTCATCAIMPRDAALCRVVAYAAHLLALTDAYQRGSRLKDSFALPDVSCTDRYRYSTVNHKSHDPCFHEKYAGLMTFVARCSLLYYEWYPRIPTLVLIVN